MTKKIFLIVLIILSTGTVIGQKLSLSDLINLCNKKNWEDVNQSLLSKDWTFYDSKKGDTYQYNIITWSFGKEYYEDKANGWFYLFTYEGFPNKIMYSVFNKESYSLIQNSLNANGFVLVDGEIEDNLISSKYSNNLYTLEIITEKRENEDWSTSVTAYSITLIKKAGVFDLDNGKKTDYYYADVKQAEYTLKNGMMNGELIVYHENGNLKKKGYFKMGKADGIFVEYDEVGILTTEYFMQDDLRNGFFKVYDNGKISYTMNFKNDIQDGQYVGYYYSDNGNLFLKQYGQYFNNEKTGTWNLCALEDNKEILMTYTNYRGGMKDGHFQDIQGDSLIIGNYLNDKLDGEYVIYLDLTRMFIGGMIRTDTSELSLLCKVNYYDGLKTGLWKDYDLSETLMSEGRYLNGLKQGEWNYYYSTWLNAKNEPLPYSQQLYLTETYNYGKLNGKSTRLSYLQVVKYPCSKVGDIANLTDTCKKMEFKIHLETSFYKDDKLHGSYELKDSTNEIVTKGNYQNDLKDGVWYERFTYKNSDNSTYFLYQEGSYLKDKREGKWIQYYIPGTITSTFYYKNDLLDGEYIEWDQFNKQKEKKQFINGKLKELITYDSFGLNPVSKYEIYDEKLSSYKCRRTEYLNDVYSIQEYWVSKSGEINPFLFEMDFLNKTSNLLDGSGGFKEGEYKLINLNNQPLITGSYHKESKIGTWTYYYYDQNIKLVSNFKNNDPIDERYYSLNGNLFTGDFTYIDNFEKIREIRTIKNGLRHGSTVYYDLNTGEKIRREKYEDGLLK